VSGIFAFSIWGLGLCESVVCASAAFLGSCTLLSIEVDQLSFPNEQDAVTFFSDFNSDLSLFSASQRDHQATIDQAWVI